MDWRKAYEAWLEADLCEELAIELRGCKDEKEIEDRFCKDLEFGTGGLRGMLGCGTNRMNMYTVARATRGLAKYIRDKSLNNVCAISYDTRKMSREFAFLAAGIMSGQGIHVYLYPEPSPTPMLSFAVRHYHCACGIMITASHNPAQYNGYKVYGADGCQITLEAAKKVLLYIEKETYFENKIPDYRQYMKNLIEYIPTDVEESYDEAVLKACMGKPQVPIRVVYTPLNGTGNIPVRRVLKKLGNVDVFVVPKQEFPDVNFTTCPCPNPELPETMERAAELAKTAGADLFLATDPDCDRVGVGEIKSSGEVRYFTGNEIGILLLDFICRYKTERGKMPEAPVVIKTIVTSDLTYCLAEKFHIEVREVLTGFKFIGEQIGRMESHKEESRYLFGFEESCGYLSGTYVRDKDGVNAAVLICQMAAWHKKQGKRLSFAMEEIYREYGWFKNKLLTYEFPGADGMVRMKEAMKELRLNHCSFMGMHMKEKVDYLNEETGLPSSDVIKMIFDENRKIIVRPSGTEPKLKIYLMMSGSSEKEVEEFAASAEERCARFIANYLKEGNVYDI
ncbi:phospho-sugar mutase [Novisyntrophococcus fermenticellae]|uniref:phospho-sugar mutase n=1 Tax=Novisyntrophococcus fermenticellae TaxID=2068655 RepID=UPI001E48A7A1|nr:phospho-sugar mutase [Novisyntrophococcus fermenticellae]